MHYKKLIPEEEKTSPKPSLENIKFHDSVYEYKEVLHADGSLYPMDITVSIIDWNGKKAILTTLRDSKERKKFEEEREELILDLKEAINNIKTL